MMKSPQDLYADFAALLDGQITKMFSSSLDNLEGANERNKAERLVFIATVQREAYRQGFADAREEAARAAYNSAHEGPRLEHDAWTAVRLAAERASAAIRALQPKETR